MNVSHCNNAAAHAAGSAAHIHAFDKTCNDVCWIVFDCKQIWYKSFWFSWMGKRIHKSIDLLLCMFRFLNLQRGHTMIYTLYIAILDGIRTKRIAPCGHKRIELLCCRLISCWIPYPAHAFRHTGGQGRQPEHRLARQAPAPPAGSHAAAAASYREPAFGCRPRAWQCLLQHSWEPGTFRQSLCILYIFYISAVFI